MCVSVRGPSVCLYELLRILSYRLSIVRDNNAQMFYKAMCTPSVTTLMLRHHPAAYHAPAARLTDSLFKFA